MRVAGEIRVWGTPRPGGSKRAFKHFHTGRIVVVEDCRKNASWRDLVAMSAREHIERHLWPANYPIDEPLSVNFTFFMARPKSHYRTGKYAGDLKASAPTFHSKKPDLTKLIRSTEDALTGILYRDDALIVSQDARKRYTGLDGESRIEGVMIRYTTEQTDAECSPDLPTDS